MEKALKKLLFFPFCGSEFMLCYLGLPSKLVCDETTSQILYSLKVEYISCLTSL